MDEEQDFEVAQEYPRWKAAIKLFVDAKFTYGDVIEHQWFYDAFWIVKPSDTTPFSVAQKATLAFVGQFTPFRQAILCDYKMDLESVIGLGYKIILPKEQSINAYKEGISDINKGFKKMVTRIVNTDLECLTNEERKENAEILAKAVMMRSMVRKVKRLSTKEAIEE